MRLDSRKNNELRPLSVETEFLRNTPESVLIAFGGTRIICSANAIEELPPWMRAQKKNGGWVTAEYQMLPSSTIGRTKRETSGLSGRTQEIQRLISRSLRSVVNLKALGDRQILVDCDVLQADGGTRTAAITGGYVALCLALQTLVKKKVFHRVPIISEVAAVSCGIIGNDILLDVDYKEDSNADVDANFVINGQGKLVEIQGTAEKKAFTEEQFLEMLKLAKKGVAEISAIQKSALI